MARQLDPKAGQTPAGPTHRDGEKLRHQEKGAGRGPLRDKPGRSREAAGEAVLLHHPLQPRGRSHPYPTSGRSAGLTRTRTHALAAPLGPRLP